MVSHQIENASLPYSYKACVDGFRGRFLQWKLASRERGCYAPVRLLVRKLVPKFVGILGYVILHGMMMQTSKDDALKLFF